MFLVGYSAGSNIILKTLLKSEGVRVGGGDGGSQALGPLRHLVAAAMCVCVTYDYRKSVANLEKTSIGRVYSKLIARQSKVSQKIVSMFIFIL